MSKHITKYRKVSLWMIKKTESDQKRKCEWKLYGR